MARDVRQQILDLTSESEAHSVSSHEIEPPATAVCTESRLLNVAHSDIYQSLRQVVSDGEKFERSDDSPYPLACLRTSQDQGYVQLKPDLAPEQPLLPAERDDLAQRLWERLKTLSDLEADVLDILTSTWLDRAKSANDRATIDVDSLIALRGIKPKQGGQGRRGGYTPEQRRTHLAAASVIFDLWLSMDVVVVYTGKGKRPNKLSLQSRPFVVTDRLGELRLYDTYMDVWTFTYVPGEVFAAFLLGTPQTALLSARALEYNFRKEWWQKRLTRYYSYLWGCSATARDYEKPLKISNIFRDGLRIEIDTRWLARTKERFVACHRALQRDDVIASWRYEQQDGPWSDWTVIVEPPNRIRRAYDEGLRAVPCFRLRNPSLVDEWGGSIRARRESLGLSQRRLAMQLDISQSKLSRAESGRGSIPDVLRIWLKVS